MAAALQRLIVHIGDHKTGSTAIQYALMRRDIVLENANYSYPVPPSRPDHNYLAGMVRGYVRDKNKSGKRTFRNVARIFKNERARFGVVSGEELEYLNPAFLEEFLSRHWAPLFDETRVLAYVRPHLSALLSVFAERMKIGFPEKNLDTFFSDRHKRFTYLPRFNQWHGTFGDQFVLRPMIRQQLADESVVSDFAATAFSGTAYSVNPTAPENESLSVEDLMRIKVIHEALASDDKVEQHAMSWTFAEQISAARATTEAPRTRVRAHRSLAEEVYRVMRDDARNMDTTFFAEAPCLLEELERAVDTAEVEPLSFEPTDWLSSSEILSLRAMSGLFAEALAADPNWPERLQQNRVDRLIAARRTG